MTDTFNPECPSCKVTIERIEKWIDNVGFSPTKVVRYNILLQFVKRLAEDKCDTHSISSIKRDAQNILKELGINYD